MSLLGLCATCSESPKGIDGHPDLHPQPLEGRRSRYLFRCSACGARWSRAYTGSGEFTWVLERTADGDGPSGGMG